MEGGEGVYRRRGRCVTDLWFQLFGLSAGRTIRGRAEEADRKGKCSGESYFACESNTFLTRAAAKTKEERANRREGGLYFTRGLHLF